MTRIGRIAAAVAGVLALVVVGRAVGGYLPAFARWVDGLGVWGPVVFIVGYALALASLALLALSGSRVIAAVTRLGAILDLW